MNKPASHPDNFTTEQVKAMRAAGKAIGGNTSFARIEEILTREDPNDEYFTPAAIDAMIRNCFSYWYGPETANRIKQWWNIQTGAAVAVDVELAKRQLAAAEMNFREDGIGYGPAELISTRRQTAEEDLEAGEEWVCLKVPSGSEVELPANLVRWVLGN